MDVGFLGHILEVTVKPCARARRRSSEYDLPPWPLM